MEQYSGRVPQLEALFASPLPFPSPPLPFIMPGSVSGHVIVFLPLPDPASILHLLHHIYFGTLFFIDQALDSGEIGWEGLARNVNYLEMGADVELVLSLYWRRVQRDSGTSLVFLPGPAPPNPDASDTGTRIVQVEGEDQPQENNELIYSDVFHPEATLDVPEFPGRVVSAPCSVESSSTSTGEDEGTRMYRRTHSE